LIACATPATADEIYILIVTDELFVDMDAAPLAEPDRRGAPAFAPVILLAAVNLIVCISEAATQRWRELPLRIETIRCDRYPALSPIAVALRVKHESVESRRLESYSTLFSGAGGSSSSFLTESLRFDASGFVGLTGAASQLIGRGLVIYDTIIRLS
jgi:hypothetical protein